MDHAANTTEILHVCRWIRKPVGRSVQRAFQSNFSTKLTCRERTICQQTLRLYFKAHSEAGVPATPDGRAGQLEEEDDNGKGRPAGKKCAKASSCKDGRCVVAEEGLARRRHIAVAEVAATVAVRMLATRQ